MRLPRLRTSRQGYCPVCGAYCPACAEDTFRKRVASHVEPLFTVSRGLAVTVLVFCGTALITGFVIVSVFTFTSKAPFGIYSPGSLVGWGMSASAQGTFLVAPLAARALLLFRDIRQVLAAGRADRGGEFFSTGHSPAETGWRVMRLAASLMPPQGGRRWLAEAESFLTEAPSALQLAAFRSYLISVPQVIAVGWTVEAARRVRVTSNGYR